LTLLLGSGLTYWVKVREENRAESRERTSRRVAFQRQAIIDIQDKALAQYLAHVQLHSAAKEHLKKEGSWPTVIEMILDAAVASQGVNAVATLSLLNTRIENEELRSIVSEIMRSPRGRAPGPDPESAALAMKEFADTMARLSILCRSLLADLY